MRKLYARMFTKNYSLGEVKICYAAIMKIIKQTLAMPTGRTLMYLSIFIIGSALHELLFQLINPTIWSNSALALTLSTLGIFVIVGALLVCEQHPVSRVTSAATLFILGLIALRIGHSVVPDPYLLVAVLCIAIIGARPTLHRQLTNSKQTVSYSVLAILIALLTAFVFTYGMILLDRIAAV